MFLFLKVELRHTCTGPAIPLPLGPCSLLGQGLDHAQGVLGVGFLGHFSLSNCRTCLRFPSAKRETYGSPGTCVHREMSWWLGPVCVSESLRTPVAGAVQEEENPSQASPDHLVPIQAGLTTLYPPHPSPPPSPSPLPLFLSLSSGISNGCSLAESPLSTVGSSQVTFWRGEGREVTDLAPPHLLWASLGGFRSPRVFPVRGTTK